MNLKQIKVIVTSYGLRGPDLSRWRTKGVIFKGVIFTGVVANLNRQADEQGDGTNMNRQRTKGVIFEGAVRPIFKLRIYNFGI